MLKRILEQQLLKSLENQKIAIVTGPRRVGKTVLLQQIREQCIERGRETQWLDFTDPAARKLLLDFSQEHLGKLLAEWGWSNSTGVLFLDEMQKFSGAGELLKLIYDHFPSVKVFASGSSSFLMMQEIGDSLAGRKELWELLPFTGSEKLEIDVPNYWEFNKLITIDERLRILIDDWLVYGSYPEIALNIDRNQRAKLLIELSDSVLFKDIFELGGVHKPQVLVELTRLLAYQVGNLVNPHELASILGIARQTVLDYIQLLERFYVVFRLMPFAVNQRDEIGTKFKVYFYDLGIRNALVGDFSDWSGRQDQGKLWENLMVLSIKKRMVYERIIARAYFWRTYDGSEVDLVIQEGQKLEAYEAKLGGKGKVPRSFLNRFPDVKSLVVSRQNQEVML